MTTPGPADARPDLLANPLFQAVCSAWQRDGRAFVGFADVLTEWGMEGEASAWVWAATGPLRSNYRKTMSHLPTEPNLMPPGPRYDSIGKNRYGWSPYNTDPYGPHNDADDLPDQLFDGGCLWFPTFPAAILWFLNRSAEVYGAAGPPRAEVPEVAGV